MDCRAMVDFIHRVDGAVRAQANLQNTKKRKHEWPKGLALVLYREFSQGDLDRIKPCFLSFARKSPPRRFTRTAIASDFWRGWKSQAETHKKMANIDKFWSLLGDAGVVAVWGEL